MAKRVNTKFVVVLSSALAAAGMGAAGLIAWRHFKPPVDPKVVLPQAEAAEKAGDLVRAIGLYAAGADAMVKSHQAGADLILAKASDLALKVAENARTPEEGIRYLQLHATWLQQAQAINPRNSEVNEKLIDESHQSALMQNDPKVWIFLEDEVSRYLSNQPSAPARMYTIRAEARLQRTEIMPVKDIPDSRMRDIAQDLKKAMEMDPKSGKAVALNARYQELEASRKLRSSTPEEANDLRAAAQKQLNDFLVKYPHDPDVTMQYAPWLGRTESLAMLARGLQAKDNDLQTQLVQTYVDTVPTEVRPQLQEILRQHASDDPKVTLDLVQRLMATESVSLLSQALAANPGNEDLGVQLNQAYMETTPPQVEMAEKVIRELVAAHPDDPVSYVRLGRFFQYKHDLTQAIATFKEGLNHINLGGSGIRLRHDLYQGLLYFNIASIDMDIAAAAGIAEPTGAAALAESMEYANKFRTAHGARGMLDLLDGRAQLLNSNVPEAIVFLHSAENNLAAMPQSEYMRMAKMLLAEASQLQRPPQLGAALDYLQAACAIQPVSSTALLQQAAVLNQLGRFAEAKTLLEDLFRQADRLPQAVLDRAKMIQALADAGTGKALDPGDDISQMHTIPALLQLAQMLLGSNEVEQALDKLNEVLAKDAGNVPALRLSLLADMRLGKKDDAIKIVDKVLSLNPDNPEFQFLKASLSNQEKGDSDAIQLKIIDSITDVYAKQLQLWAFYNQRADWDKALAALQTAEEGIGDVSKPEGKLRRDDIIDRLFTASMTAALLSKSQADQPKYWALAQSYVSKAEQFNLDGVNGTLYRGRLEFVKSGGASGLNLIEKAVADRPDYAQGHNFLAQAYLTLKIPKTQAALQEMRLALHIAPNDIALLRQTIRLLMQSPTPANVQEAQSLMLQGRAVAPNDPGLAIYADLLGDRTEAIARREANAKNNPSDRENLRRLAVLYLRPASKDQQSIDKEALDKAIALIEPLTHVDKPDMGDILMLASMYAEKRNVDKALSLFEPLVSEKVDPDERYQSLQVLGDFCRQIGKYKLSEGYFQDAMKLARGGDDTAQRHLGDLYFETDELAKAETVYRAVLDESKSDAVKAASLRRLIEVLIRLHKIPDANELLESRILSQDPSDPVGLVLRAFSRIQDNRPQDALADLKQVLDKIHDQPEALFYRALANLTLRSDVENAANDLFNLTTRFPTTLKYRLLLVQVDRYLHKYSEAAAQYAEMLKQRPDLTTVRKEYVGFLMGMVMVQQRTSPDSLEPLALAVRQIRPVDSLQDTLKEAIALEPNEPVWVLSYGDLAMLVGDLSSARKIYEAVYKTYPENAIGVNSYARVLNINKEYDLAVIVTSAFLEKHTDIADIYLRRAAAYAGLKKTDDARKDVDRVFSMALDEAKTTKSYAGFFTAINQAADVLNLNGVVDRLRMRLGAFPDDQASGVGLLHVLVTQGRAQEAIEVAKSLKIPADDKPLNTIFLRESATAYFQGGDLKASDAQFKELFKLNPDDIEGLNNYAFILADNMKKPRDALPFAEKAVKLIDANPDQGLLAGSAGTVYDTLGWVRYLAGDTQGAIEMLHRSIEILPTSATYLHLAISYKKVNRDTDERTAAEQGIKLCTPDDPSLKELQKIKDSLPPA